MTETVDGAQHFYEAQSEQDFMRNVMVYAKARAWIVYHTHIAKRSAEGFPDLCMVRGERLVFAELKRERPRLKSGRESTSAKYEPTAAQWAWLEALAGVSVETDGAMAAFLWRPSDWPEIEAVLR